MVVKTDKHTQTFELLTFTDAVSDLASTIASDPRETFGSKR